MKKRPTLWLFAMGFLLTPIVVVTYSIQAQDLFGDLERLNWMLLMLLMSTLLISTGSAIAIKRNWWRITGSLGYCWECYLKSEL